MGNQFVDPAGYVELLCRTYTALKAVDPDIVVISGALAQQFRLMVILDTVISFIYKICMMRVFEDVLTFYRYKDMVYSVDLPMSVSVDND